MQYVRSVVRSTLQAALILGVLSLLFAGSLRAQISFSASGLEGANVTNPTSLQFGPDGRLYVSQQDGLIYAYDVVRNGANDYDVVATEIIDLVQKDVPNHDDDGTPNGTDLRQVTGILVTGTSTNPVLYVTSSDWRIGAGSGGTGDLGLDTNSGVISRLTWVGSGIDDPDGFWDKVDLVRGLPRSEENHAPNGLQLDVQNNVLYVAQGGNTNAGAPSTNFAYLTEYALAAAVLSIDLDAIEAMPVQEDNGYKWIYDLPTLDDPTRANANGIDDPSAPGYDGVDVNDPFGGNDGLNQAKIVPGGPVQVYSSGFRNAYDLLINSAGRMYVIDNGANQGWGGYPVGEGPDGTCTNDYDPDEPGSTGPSPNEDQVNNEDNLHFVPGPGYYAGHPTPIRGNPAGAGLFTHDGSSGVWRTSTTDPDHPLPPDWPPVPVDQANPEECDYHQPGVDDGALITYAYSTNGIAEYTASNFSGALQGDILLTQFNSNKILRVTLNDAGDAVENNTTLASGFGKSPLDVIAQGDNDVFGGTVWAVTYGADAVTVFEPSDYDGQDPGECTAADDPNIDEDGDLFSNADELTTGNNTDPCSSADRPPNADETTELKEIQSGTRTFLLSDINDTDDDNDGLLDTSDPFPLDADNGTTTDLPVDYSFFNNDPGTGFFGIGFTGLMTNGTEDYLNLFDENNLVAGGASGLFTIAAVTEGDAITTTNNQQDAFQFGVNVSTATGPFTIHARTTGPFFGGSPGKFQSQGIQIGTGNQSSYLKLVVKAWDGGGLQILYESNDTVVDRTDVDNVSGILSASHVDLYLSVDPATGTVQPKYQVGNGAIVNAGSPIPLSSDLLEAVQGNYTVGSGLPSGLAVGVIATSFGSAPEFTATWDFIKITQDPTSSTGTWETFASTNDPTARHENAFVQAGDKFYLIGGRETQLVEIYDPETDSWSQGAESPVLLHHFQAVELDGLIYIVGAFTGTYPDETPVPNIYIYDPASDTWTVGPEIPEDRRRGSAGAVVYNDKIYLVAGIQNGHTSGHVAWFDVFDPATGTWTTLADAPRARDHFHAAVVGNKLYAIGGRNTAYPDHVFDQTIPEVDVYDFTSGTWSTLSANLPTERAAAAVAVLGNEILVMGGESGSQTTAHDENEALDVTSESWRTLEPMITGRHGTQAIVSNGNVYVTSGSPDRGGGRINAHEVFYLTTRTEPSGTAITKGTLAGDPASLDFGEVAVGSSSTLPLTVTNTDGNQAILLEDLTVTGDADFTFDFPHTLPISLAPGSDITFDVTFSPSSTDTKSGTLAINHTGTGDPLSITLSGGEGSGSGPPDPGTVLYRVNAGGPQLAAADGSTPAWSADDDANPSPYRTNGTNTYSTSDAIDTSDPSIPTSVPDALFQTERWDQGTSGDALSQEMQWSFPVTDGTQVEVRLYLAEIFLTDSGDNSNDTKGPRVFDVQLEETTPTAFNDIDQYATHGHDAGYMVSATATSDGSIDLVFIHDQQNPTVKGIEILVSGSTAENTPPSITPIDDQNVEEGQTLTVNVSATDADGHAIALSAQVVDDVGSAVGFYSFGDHGDGTGTLELTPQAGDAGTYTATITATDGIANSTETFSINVSESSGTSAPALNAKVFLEGPFSSQTGSMQATLNAAGQLPVNQPYSGSPWNYSGTESVANTDGDGNGNPDFFDNHPNIVDWVLLEARTGDPSSPPMTVAARRAAFVKSDGTIVDVDGQSAVSFDNLADGDYYVAVIHRHHLDVMSAQALSLSAGTTTSYDFTTAQTQAFDQGGPAMKQLASGPYGMFAGDANASGSNTASDQALWLDENGTDGYLQSDFNLSGGATASDQALWITNNGFDSQSPSATAGAASKHGPALAAASRSDAGAANTVEARFVKSVNQDANTLDVTIQLRAASAPEIFLGSSTLRFNFNDAALDLPTGDDGTHAEANYYTFHRFSGAGSEGGTYSADVTRPTATKASVNIVYTPPAGGGGGDAIPDDFIDVVTLHFPIVASEEPAGLEWITTPGETDLFETDNVTPLNLETATAVAAEGAIELPDAYLIEPAYPNPFNPETTVRFAVRERQIVTVELYDALGRCIRQLMRREVAASDMQTLRIDGNDLSSGLYFVRFTGTTFTETIKITLVK